MRAPRTSPLILASVSPRRASLLRAAGIPFRAIPSRVREHEPRTGERAPAAAVARHNARLKCEAVARTLPGCWVLGADTVVALAGRMFGKPRDLAEAARILARLAGRTHRVVTAVCLCRWPGQYRRFTVTSHVTFRPLDAEGIRRYLGCVHTLDKAGAYAAQERPRLIIRRIRGSRTNVVGLPMERLRRELRSVGFPHRTARAKRLAFSPPAP